MNTSKTVIITLTLMTTVVFADFTIKDLFVSGGTHTTEESTHSTDGTKDSKKVRKEHDCQ